jgi:formylmethanofuran dehydrogenase subunit C
MSGLILTLKANPDGRVDMSPLTPDTLQGKDLKQIDAIPLQCGGCKVMTGDLFAIEGEAGLNFEIRQSCERLEGIGSRMKQGEIRVMGTAGAYLGQDMKGGVITVQGDAGLWAGAGMRGGRIEILGNAGDYLGAVRIGEQQGMRGGTILVTGHAGDRLGERMRRGSIIVRRNAGSYAGANMLAGTLIVMGRLGPCAGFGMRRGTIVTPGMLGDLLPGFSDCGTLDLGFLDLMYRELASHGPRYDFLKDLSSLTRRFAGDAGVGGKGEILVLQ